MILWRTYPLVSRPYRQCTLVFCSVLSLAVLINDLLVRWAVGASSDLAGVLVDEVTQKNVPFSIDIPQAGDRKRNRHANPHLPGACLLRKETFLRPTFSCGGLPVRLNILCRRASMINMADALCQIHATERPAAAIRDGTQACISDARCSYPPARRDDPGIRGQPGNRTSTPDTRVPGIETRFLRAASGLDGRYCLGRKLLASLLNDRYNLWPVSQDRIGP